MINFRKFLCRNLLRPFSSNSLANNPIFYESSFITKNQVNDLINVGKLTLIKSILSQYGSWDKWFSSFSEVNIEPKLLIQVLKSDEVNCDIDMNDLSRKHELFLSLGIELRNIIMKFPGIVELDSYKIENYVSLLNNHVSKKRMCNIIEEDPYILTNSASDVEEAIKYAFKVMKIPTDTIYSSSIWSYPKKHLLIRHKYLVFAGIYPESGKATSPSHVIPKFNSFLTLPDKEFVTQVAQMPFDEFIMFKKNFELLVDVEQDDG